MTDIESKKNAVIDAAKRWDTGYRSGHKAKARLDERLDLSDAVDDLNLAEESAKSADHDDLNNHRQTASGEGSGTGAEAQQPSKHSPSPTFKKGDLVRCLSDDGSRLSLNHIYVITQVSNNGKFVNIEGSFDRVGSWFLTRFEPFTYKFDRGETVEFFSVVNGRTTRGQIVSRYIEKNEEWYSIRTESGLVAHRSVKALTKSKSLSDLINDAIVPKLSGDPVVFKQHVPGDFSSYSLPKSILNALEDMVSTYSSKNKDYADTDNPYSNFEDTAYDVGIDDFEDIDAVRVAISTKVGRLRTLKQSGKAPENESVVDTYRDLAVYSLIAFAMAKQDVS